MLGTLLGALRSIIDLLIKRKQSQKTDIDVELAKRELQEKTRLVQLASFQDVRRYDPLVQELERTARRLPAGTLRKGPSSILIGAIVFGVVAAIIAFFWLQMRP